MGYILNLVERGGGGEYFLNPVEEGGGGGR